MQRPKGDPFSNKDGDIEKRPELAIECHYRLCQELFSRCKNLLYLRHSPLGLHFVLQERKNGLFIQQNLVSEHIG